jgi:hypothetical protein
MAYDNNMRGVLFRNDRKRNDKDPEYTGNAEVDGVEYWLSAWVNEAKKGKNEGKKFFSISFKAKNEKRGSKSNGRRPMDDEDIPF